MANLILAWSLFDEIVAVTAAAIVFQELLCSSSMDPRAKPCYPV